MKLYSSYKALIIGIAHYDDPQYDLSYARSDAEALADLLSNEFGFGKIWTLYDNHATKQNIIHMFEQNLQKTDEDDALLIFFAGHGITITSAIGDDRGFLVPYDGNPDQPYANLSMTMIRDDYLPMIPAKHIFLVVDACYGGLAMRDVTTLERSQATDNTILAELTRRDRKVRQVLSAGTKDQRVLDGGIFGHSVFTASLIETLCEANPYITADHVGIHVRERVARDSMDRNHRQTPQFGYIVGGEGSFVFHRSQVTRKKNIIRKFRRGSKSTDLPIQFKPVSTKTYQDIPQTILRVRRNNGLGYLIMVICALTIMSIVLLIWHYKSGQILYNARDLINAHDIHKARERIDSFWIVPWHRIQRNELLTLFSRANDLKTARELGREGRLDMVIQIIKKYKDDSEFQDVLEESIDVASPKLLQEAHQAIDIKNWKRVAQIYELGQGRVDFRKMLDEAVVRARDDFRGYEVLSVDAYEAFRDHMEGTHVILRGMLESDILGSDIGIADFRIHGTRSTLEIRFSSSRIDISPRNPKEFEKGKEVLIGGMLRRRYGGARVWWTIDPVDICVEAQ